MGTVPYRGGKNATDFVCRKQTPGQKQGPPGSALWKLRQILKTPFCAYGQIILFFLLQRFVSARLRQGALYLNQPTGKRVFFQAIGENESFGVKYSEIYGRPFKKNNAPDQKWPRALLCLSIHNDFLNPVQTATREKGSLIQPLRLLLQDLSVRLQYQM